MKFRACCITVSLLSVLACATLAQTASPNSSPASTQVPRLIRFSGVAQDETRNPMTGVVGITFSLYEDQQGGSPLWVETQNVQADANGRYTSLLGSASAEGMPLELFSSGEAQWLGVQIQGQPEHARVLLVSVPYALKAHEAETLSGRSISDFVLLNKTASTSSKPTDAPLGSNGTSTSSSPLIDNDGPTSFAGSNATQVVSVIQNGSGHGLSATSHALAAVAGTITGKSNTAVYGLASNTSKGSNAAGVTGQSNTETGPGVAGYANGIDGTGVLGVANATTGGTGVSGISNATSGNTDGVYGQSASPTGAGMVGVNNATTGYANGVYGQSASTMGNAVVGIATSASSNTVGVYGSGNGTGVYGNSANGVGVGGMGNTLGVWGDSATINGTGVAAYSDATSGSGNGVYGQSASTSGIGVSGNAIANTGNAYGVYGGTATTGFGAGVFGIATASTGNAYGLFGQSSGTSGNGVFGYANAPSGSTIGVAGFVESPAGTAGYFVARSGSGLILQGISGNPGTQVFTVDASGNLDISGNLTVAGSKSARVKLQDGREVALYAVESPENWFEDFGTAQLQGGATRVSLEPGFLQTVDTAADYHVFLTPKGDCHGLYVAGTTSAGFEVRELGGGNASITFDYRIVAHRRGFENVRLQDVHLPQGPKNMQASLASLRSGKHMVVTPPPPRVIPVQPHPAAQLH
jgi:hypothetical protein